MRDHRLLLCHERTYLQTHRDALPGPPDIDFAMLKTFSFSALFFMAVGLFFASHLSLPF